MDVLIADILGNIDCIMKTFQTDPIIIYIVVGGANNHVQQFPPVLQMIRALEPSTKFILIYFDPHHEHPPTAIKEVFGEYNEVTEQKTDTAIQYTLTLPRKDASVFMSLYKRNVHVHSGDTSRDSINITELLRTINTISIENNASMIYHEFTGRAINAVSEIFDEELKNHLDQIVYGISARQDHGCFFDLTKDDAFFAVKKVNSINSMNNRPVFKMFNYYKHINNNTLGGLEYDNDIKEYPLNMHKYIEAQSEQLVAMYMTKFKNSDMYVMRQVHKRLHNNDNKDNNDNNDTKDTKKVELYTPHVCGKLTEIYKELWDKKNYEILYELVIEQGENTLNKIVFLGNFDVSGEEILKFITMDNDQTKWYSKYAEFGLS